MKKISMMLSMAIIVMFGALPLPAEELLKWELLETLPDGRSYNYSPNSIRKIDAFITEVYDGVVDSRAKDVRQLRIDCVQKKWAIGETKSWRGGEPVASPNLSKDGWVWHPVEGNLNEKLVEAVCGK